jgi:hypothetical protein
MHDPRMEAGIIELVWSIAKLVEVGIGRNPAPEFIRDSGCLGESLDLLQPPSVTRSKKSCPLGDYAALV